MALSLDAVKVLILLLLLVMTFTFGMIPVLLIKCVHRKTKVDSQGCADLGHQRHQQRKVRFGHRSLSFLSCFSAGVFLATCFLDLLPNVRQHLQDSFLKIHVANNYPVAEFVMVLGLFVILIIEQTVLTVKESSNNSSVNDAQQPLINHSDEEHEHLLKSHDEYDHSLGGICDEPHFAGDVDAMSSQVNADVIEEEVTNSEHESSVHSKDHNTNSSSRGDSDTHIEHHASAHPDLHSHSPLRATLLLIALSLHSVFEGLGIGLQTSSAEVWQIFAALALHKNILSFSLGTNLVHSRITLKTTIQAILAFAIASPVGVAVGIALIDLWTSTSSAVVHGILQGVASGTFLYIIFFEILPKEFNCEIDRMLKVFFLIIGYGVVAGIMFLNDDNKIHS